MIENRWAVELVKDDYYNNSVKFPCKFLKNWDNASTWISWLYGGPNNYLDTHIYTSKQIRERVMSAVKAAEERRKKWLESQKEEEYEI